MIPYIQWQADNLLVEINVPKLFNVTHSFKFMEQLKIQNKTNFFERRTSEYSKQTMCEKTIELDF